MSKTNKLRTYKDGVAIITGGASGIGRSLGKSLAKRGCTVVLADIQLETAKETAKEIERSGGSAAAIKMDVTNKEEVNAAVRHVFDTYGRIDYMFNNAGIAINGKFCDFDQDEWDRCININLLGVVYGVRAVHPIMEKQGFGHIINTASIAGIYPWPTTYAYAATKHAVAGLTTVLSAELAGTGIYASVLCPGTIRTAIIEDGARKERWAGVYSEQKLKDFMARAKGMQPDAFAEKAVRKIAKRKPIIAIPFSYKIYWLIYRLSPALGISVSNMIYKIIMKEIGSCGEKIKN